MGSGSDLAGALWVGGALWLGACSFQVPAGTPGDGGPDPDDGAIDGAVDGAVDAAIDAPPDAFIPGRRKRITIDPARVTGTHGAFPVWFTITDPELGARALADGTDIHFTDANGVALAYELQQWDKPSGRLEAWVRMQVLDAEPTVFDVRYGDPTLAHAANAPAVFTSSFAAVWHLESATVVPDARGVRTGTPVNLADANSAAAQLGRGVAFTGNTGEITFTNPLTGAGAHTISLWVSQAATTDNDALVVLGNDACGQSRWLHGRYDRSTMAAGLYCAPNDWVNPNVNIIGAGFTLVHWVYEGANRVSRLYRNGALVAGPFTHGGTTNTQGTGGHLGNAPGPWGDDMGAHATLDEVRIASVARSPGWIATEHANQSAPATFYTVGAEQLP